MLLCLFAEKKPAGKADNRTKEDRHQDYPYDRFSSGDRSYGDGRKIPYHADQHFRDLRKTSGHFLRYYLWKRIVGSDAHVRVDINCRAYYETEQGSEEYQPSG